MVLILMVIAANCIPFCTRLRLRIRIFFCLLYPFFIYFILQKNEVIPVSQINPITFQFHMHQ